MFPQDARISQFAHALTLSQLPPDDADVAKRIRVTLDLVAAPLRQIAEGFLAATADHGDEDMGE
jgi:hypothetical protein